MNRIRLATIVSLVVILTGITVMVGWFLDITTLKSILPQYPTMKFITAFSFVLSGLILFFITRYEEGCKSLANVIIPISGFMITLVMVTIFISTFIDIYTGIEGLFIEESSNPTQVNIPGRPSIGTMMAFILIAFISWFYSLKPNQSKSVLVGFGSVIVAIGCLGILGYMIGVHSFYFDFNNISSAMALHTSILFSILGVSFILVGSGKK